MGLDLSRRAMLDRARDDRERWDFLIIGGGATGLGVAVDAAARGLRTLLLERSDFAKGTSSRSTKLVHGGVRYLRQGNVGLVLEALRERGILRANAPHLVHDLPFVVPNYDWWEAPFYGIGLKVYDLLAGKYGFGASRVLDREETIARIPTIEPGGLRGGVIYHDGQFDDARLAVNLMQTAVERGAVAINYAPVTGLIKQGELVAGVRARDAETGETFEARARVVINATGAFADAVRRMDEAGAEAIIRPSQGVHLVLPREFLPGDSAIMVPHTDDGRVLFAIPWHEAIVVGTTDTPIEEAGLEPRALPEEVEFLLKHAARYLTRDPEPGDVLSVFAGVRPLVASGGGSTAQLSRDHSILISRSGLLTVAGGKWTTYRKMAEDTVDQAMLVAGLDERDCPTRELRIHGALEGGDLDSDFQVYGSDAADVAALCESAPNWNARLHARLPYHAGEVIWAARREMARTVEDFLARRSRALLLDARASIEMAPRVAELLAGELGRDAAWIEDQVREYSALARGYLLVSP